MDQSSKVYIKLEDVHDEVVKSLENLGQHEQSAITLSDLLDKKNLSESSEPYSKFPLYLNLLCKHSLSD